MSSLTISGAPLCGTFFPIQEHLPRLPACARSCSMVNQVQRLLRICGSVQLYESSASYILQNSIHQTLEIWETQIWHSTSIKQSRDYWDGSVGKDTFCVSLRTDLKCMQGWKRSIDSWKLSFSLQTCAHTKKNREYTVSSLHKNDWATRQWRNCRHTDVKQTVSWASDRWT